MFLELHDAVKTHGGIRPAARALGMPESTLRERLQRELQEALTANPPPVKKVFPLPKDGYAFYLITSAQDRTLIHEGFWDNLLGYVDWLREEFRSGLDPTPVYLIVGGFIYKKYGVQDAHYDNLFGPKSTWWDKRVAPFLVDQPTLLTPKLIFCGEQNTLPTAVEPLSGFETYTRDRWGIFPHPKIRLRSIPTMKNDLTKQIMTTGAVTLPNYRQQKAGIKAAFTHTIGAAVVAVAPDGAFWVRHIMAEPDGSFQDLDRIVRKGKVTTGHRVEALTFGDVHHEKLDPQVARRTWGYCTERHKVIDEFPCLDKWLRPKYRFLHDVSDFSARNHHNIKDHHFIFATHKHKKANVKDALYGCANFISEISKKREGFEDGITVVVQSNHDNALLKWIKGADYKTDPENAIFFLECELQCYRWLEEGQEDLPIFEFVLRKAGLPDNVTFVSEDSSFIICGDIECALHGHLGANGAKASANAFVRMGPKSNTAHTHSPAITDGNFTCGVSGKLDMGYNKGLSSWSQTHTVTYPNGKRALLTMMHGRFSEVI